MTDDPEATQRDVRRMRAADFDVQGLNNPVEIGRGGFGVVYRCDQPDLDRVVAVKVLDADPDGENRSRFLREQRAMGRLTGHPNIVTIFQVGATDSGRPYIVMQYHPRDSLDRLIREHGPLPLDQALRLGVKMAGALETAHRQGIVHRDVKPGNILITDYDEPQLSDFGIAHVAGGFKTTSGTVTGSPAFIAPEVLGGAAPSVTADIYSMGATLFCALTGHAAFERHSGEQLVAQFLRIATAPTPRLGEHGISEDVSAVIERAMAVAPGDRYSSAAELGDQLRLVQDRHGFALDDVLVRTEPGNSRPLGLGPTPAPVSTGPSTGLVGKGNLPAELTSFVGRHTELSEIKSLLSASPLVTLTGIGGVGKTRLALRVATELAPGFQHGAWLVELGELTDESLLSDVAATTLGIREAPASTRTDALVEFLHARDLLLIIDNCEHLIDAVAELAETVLRSCPDVRILATSREPLVIGGEAVFRVPPLTVPGRDHAPGPDTRPRSDAIALFAERAKERVPTFEVTGTNAHAVHDICDRLDGLPLAIELAAGRLRAMSVEQLRERLSTRYTLLTQHNRSAPNRQQTLRLSIDWSYELCTAEEQSTWWRLSTFVGGFDLDAAETVCDAGRGDDEILDLLTSLIDKSILIREDTGTRVRFRLLETLRDYGRARAEQAGETDALSRRHRDWCERMVLHAESHWISARQLEFVDQLERELPNIRGALEYCVAHDVDVGVRIAAALFPFWNLRGMFSEGRRWLDRLLDAEDGDLTVDRVKALFSASLFAQIQRDLETGSIRAAQAREAADTLDDPRVRALATHATGLLALASGDPDGACTALSRSLEGFAATGSEPVFVVDAYVVLGLASDLAGDFDRAIQCFEQALMMTESAGEKAYRGFACWSLSITLWRRGDRHRATTLLRQGLRISHRIDPLGTAMLLEALGWTEVQDGRYRRAAVLLGAATEIAESKGAAAFLYPHLATHHEQAYAECRIALGDNIFEDTVQSGRRMGYERAVDYALTEG
ncbi:protein kinase [Rhodococcus sp. T2V]|uniref:protein kinase domain-containing protein n=1 Tax=Rhodococcus sp. T2V TaxID=3034164 RepID=UPI0023E24E80|nr:protein kinase [Rhodococcus sp. T2V]MDF3311360.1 protein kinase [Rhodococcus sp. T2V]